MTLQTFLSRKVKEFQMLLNAAVTLVQMQIRGIDKDTANIDQAQQIRNVLEHIADIKDATLQEAYLKELKDYLSVNDRYVEAWRKDVKRIAAEKEREQEQADSEKAIREIKASEEKEKEEKHNQLMSVDTSLVKIHLSTIEIFGTGSTLIELVIAVVTSLYLQNEMLLWLIVIGVPSSLKTEIVSAFRELNSVYFIDTLTENSFISGYMPENGSASPDMLAELDGKSLIIKELAPILNLAKDSLLKFIGDLTAIYDRMYSKFMGTRGRVEYNASFSFIACATPQAIMNSQEFLNKLGNRFLQYRIPKLEETQIDESFERIWQGLPAKKVNEWRKQIAAYAYRIMNTAKKEVEIPPLQRKRIDALAKFLARGRTVLNVEQYTGKNSNDKEYTGYHTSSIQTEEPFRILNQLITLTKVLTIIHGRTTTTDHELEIVRQVVISSLPIDRSEVITLFANGMQTIDRAGAAEDLKKTYAYTMRTLTELEATEIIEQKKEDSRTNQQCEYFDSSVPKESRHYFYTLKEEYKTIICEKWDDLDHIKNLQGNTPL